MFVDTKKSNCNNVQCLTMYMYQTLMFQTETKSTGMLKLDTV